MGFEEDIVSAFDASLASKATAKKDRSDFCASWTELRNSIISKRLHRAAAALRSRVKTETSKDDAGVDTDKGTIWLSVRYEGHEHRLTFAPRPEKREVECSSSIGESWKELIPLDDAIEENLRRMVVRFAGEVGAS